MKRPKFRFKYHSDAYTPKFRHYYVSLYSRGYYSGESNEEGMARGQPFDPRFKHLVASMYRL